MVTPYHENLNANGSSKEHWWAHGRSRAWQAQTFQGTSRMKEETCLADLSTSEALSITPLGDSIIQPRAVTSHPWKYG